MICKSRSFRVYVYWRRADSARAPIARATNNARLSALFSLACICIYLYAFTFHAAVDNLLVDLTRLAGVEVITHEIGCDALLSVALALQTSANTVALANLKANASFRTTDETYILLFFLSRMYVQCSRL